MSMNSRDLIFFSSDLEMDGSDWWTLSSSLPWFELRWRPSCFRDRLFWPGAGLQRGFLKFLWESRSSLLSSSSPSGEELISDVDDDESLDTVKIEGLRFLFLDLFCLSVKSMTILVKFLTLAASSSMEGSLLLCCDVPGSAGVMSVVCKIILEGSASERILLRPGISIFSQFCLVPLGLKKVKQSFCQEFV